ncbi:hypothetical protein ACFOON_13275 [Novosphingobium piscinae]|uniref:Uncharacterized protein n=1 Tax=Novosphingobium piscinae TaxID=1507448 RepID=A0A7X1KQH7_9SPHN|nr:hypothetical protein [Novosphingobium piscinae]MBC2669746.1 hypothetical protein [Novosphingobium piscinae]
MTLRPKPVIAVVVLALSCVALQPGPSGAADPGTPRARALPPPAPPTTLPVALPPVDPAVADTLYPFYMPTRGLRRPAVRLVIRCDASRAAGREVYAGRGADSLGGRVEGGFEFVYEALDGAGRPCVYPFAPWQPQVVGPLDGTQYLIRSSIPGRRVTFRTNDPWASLGLRLFDIGTQRIHFELRDVELDFPGAIQPKGALNLEVFDGQRPGLFSAVLRRVRLYGGKNALFLPSGQTMLFVEDSDIAGNVGTNTDQEHSTYINGTLVTHLRSSVWRGQRAWQDQASGHQLKDKAYLRIYENLTVSNVPAGSPPSAMPLIDASSFGFTWANYLRLYRVAPLQTVRDTLVDLRAEIVYGQPQNYPWPVLVTPAWRMPPAPLGVLDRVYLSVFQNVTVESFRTEPYVFALRPQGLAMAPGGSTTVEGQDRTTRAQQRMVSLAFNTRGRFTRAFSPEGWTYVDPVLPPGAEWVRDRDAFIRHALGLIGR